jgi:hypothetical protein
MEARADEPRGLDADTREFYCQALSTLRKAGMPFLVGGAYAFERYTGIARHTKDLDIFVREADRYVVLQTFADAGYHAELTFPHWLGKAFCSGAFVDVIFGSGNGIARVDDGWFEHAVDGKIFDLPVRLCPVEEMIWSKAFVQERERYDGADVAHLIRAQGRRLDWQRLLERFGPHWRVLLSHVTLFGFVYPSERDTVPTWLTRELASRLLDEADEGPAAERVCQGTLLSREQYLVDVDRWGYHDARLAPTGTMTEGEVAHWTAAIDDD